MFTFVTLSYSTALAVDLSMLLIGLPALVWGLGRMWCVALSTVVCLAFFQEGVVAKLKGFLGLSKRAILYHLLAPLFAYAALALYIAITLPLGLFNFEAYIDHITSAIRTADPSLSELQARRLAMINAIVQIPIAYLAAISVNTIAALGEELGWRGYLYVMLGSSPSLRNTLVIGALWGLWHAPAIALLGYNYYAARYAGVVLFTALATTLTYPHLLLVSRSGSVLPASSLHGAVNALWGLTMLASDLPLELRELILGLGTIGVASWALLDVVILYTTRLAARRYR